VPSFEHLAAAAYAPVVSRTTSTVKIRKPAPRASTLFDHASPASHEALHGLRAVLEYIGFRVVKKADAEGTLRAYPRRIHGYPLLNPRFVRLSREAELEIHIWSRAANLRVDRAVLSYARATRSRYVESGRAVGEYWLHGLLYVPVELRGRQATMPDFQHWGVGSRPFTTTSARPCGIMRGSNRRG
jgi:hypothetical protein